jgi:hypothetical protein
MHSLRVFYPTSAWIHVTRFPVRVRMARQGRQHSRADFVGADLVGCDRFSSNEAITLSGFFQRRTTYYQFQN